MTTPAIQPDHERRAELLHALGLTAPDPKLDEFAVRLSLAAAVPYAMVNIFGTHQQFFGLATPRGGELPTVGRSMPLDHGYCPEVARRRSALVLPSVYVAPRFASNPVADQIGIRSYAGAPLIHEDIVLGTVCFVGRESRPRSEGRAMLALIKSHRNRVLDFIHRRAGYLPR
ncbi:GAF domain-containing protein [Streptomyces sp. BE133]|uniref:GAF domain-containing protein n=1 Tax=Streptomyces sp. BE133 TaxID=3002523 RepID=UPI002E77555B|nr:GAF domain-containing protein [Streptomyces sp. BE133]MEE1807641.1 GAF domain-containing protein [Streptomyces sp. BE133]